MNTWLSRLTTVTALTILTACSPVDEPAPVQGLVYCTEGSPESFNPQMVTSGTTIDSISQQVYDRLLDISPQTGDLVPALAQAWTVSEDGLRYRFKLRPGVHFHTTAFFSPTREFSATDVVFTFKRVLDQDHPYHFVAPEYPYFDSVDWADLVAQVQALADDEVEFILKHPDSSFLSTLATDFAAILSQEYAQQLLQQQNPEQLDELPIGTGPFVFREYQKDVLIRYYANNLYWKGPPQQQQLVIDIVPDNTKRLAKLLTHECDVAPIPRMAELNLLKSRADFSIDEKTAMNIGYWAFNTQKPPFSDVKVRQALAHAVNRQNILQAVYFGHAVLANSVLPPNSWAFVDDLNQPEYNPDLAKSLLVEAGYPKGFSMDIWAMPVQRNYNPNAQKMAELIQADLARIGIRARIVSYEWNTFRRKLKNFEHDSVLIGWSADNADPDNFLRPLFSCAAAASGSNRANWCDSHFDDLLAQAVLTTEPSQRHRYYREAQEYLLSQMPLLPLAHSKRFLVRGDRIHGIETNPYGGINFVQAEKRP